MKKNRKNLVILSVAALALGATAWAATAAAPAWQPGFATGPRGPVRNLVQATLGRILTLRADLDVTPEQRMAIREVVEGYRPAIRPMLEKMVASRRALHETVVAEQPNEAAIRHAAADMGATITEAALLASRVAAEVRPLLTAEQIARLQEFKVDQQFAVDTWLQKEASGLGAGE